MSRAYSEGVPNPDRVRVYERDCGPWDWRDLPADIFVDIRVFDPRADVTEQDCEAFVATLEKPGGAL